jgi:subtilase family serine protease
LFSFPVTSWPDSDPLVTGVGGTQLSLDAQDSRTSPDTVWNDSFCVPANEFIFGDDGPNALAGGGGKSAIFKRPIYQDLVGNVVGDSRGVPDISMSGACDGAVDVFQSFPGEPAGWFPTCGTSEATPLFAGIVSLADQVAGHPLGLINPALYALSALHAPGIVDVTSGNNTVTFSQSGGTETVTGFSAGPGYDLASGVGTVYAPTSYASWPRSASPVRSARLCVLIFRSFQAARALVSASNSDHLSPARFSRRERGNHCPTSAAPPMPPPGRPLPIPVQAEQRELPCLI